MYDFLSGAGQGKAGVTFVNADDPVLVAMALEKGLDPIVYYGDADTAAIGSGKIIANDPLLILEWTDRRSEHIHAVQTHLTGEYNLPNILVAIAIGLYFDIDPAAINAGISGYQPNNNRSQITHTATNTLICDYYNANPSSMAVAIENLGKLDAPHKVLILGDMFEMGEEATAEHEAIIKKALAARVDERIFIGPEFQKAAQLMDHGPSIMDNTVFHPSVEAASAYLKNNPIQNATVLIKGSRGMALERLVELF